VVEHETPRLKSRLKFMFHLVLHTPSNFLCIGDKSIERFSLEYIIVLTLLGSISLAYFII